MLGKDYKFEPFTWQANFIFNFLFFAPYMISVFALYISWAKKVFTLDEGFYPSIIVLLVFFIFIAFKLKDFTEWLDSLISRLKCKLYSFALSDEYPEFITGKILKSKPDELLLDNNSQITFISEVAFKISLSNSRERKVFYLEGKSGAGKSSAIIELLRQLISHQYIYNVYRNIYFIDFCHIEQDVDSVAELLKKSKTKKSIIILENYHMLDKEKLSVIGNSVISKQYSQNNDVLILTSQPVSSSIRGIKEVLELVDFTKSSQGYYYIDKPSLVIDDSIPVSISSVSTLSEKIHLLHMLNQSNNSSPKEKIKLVTDIASRTIHDPDMEIVIAVIVALSIHRGSFKHKEFKYALKTLIKKELFFLTRFLKYQFYILQFNSLEKIGFIKRSITQDNVYIFHDELAKIYKMSEYKKSRIFKSVFDFLIKIRSEKEKGNNLLLWLYTIELIEENNKEFEIFRLAQLSGNTDIMLQNLLRIYNGMQEIEKHRDEKKVWVYRELAILFELSGDYTESVQFYNESISLTNDEYEHDVIFLDMLELNHGRIEESYTEIQNNLNILSKKSSRYRRGVLATGFRFWIAHINIHFGNFSYDEMDAVVCEIEEDFEYLYSQDPYKTVQLLRRSYFDLLRISYLRGEFDSEFFVKTASRPASTYLFKYEPLYSGYYKKHLSAQYLQYNVIYRYFLFKEEFDFQSIKNITGILFISEYNMSDTIAILEKEYENSSDFFKSHGNKSSYSTLLRLSEIEIMKNNLDIFKVESYLHKYKSYISNKKIPDFFGNLQTISAKLKLNELVALKVSNDYSEINERKIKVVYENVINLLDSALVWYSENHNSYGVFRVNFLRSISKYINDFDSDLNSDLNSIKSVAVKFSYNRELEIIEHINSQTKINLNFIFNLIKYYPIVIQ